MLHANGHASAATPSQAQVFQGLLAVSAAMGERYTYWHRGAYHFDTGVDGWTVSVTPESAGRFRLEACLFGSPRTKVWCLADGDRLAGLVCEMAHEVRASRATT